MTGPATAAAELAEEELRELLLDDMAAFDELLDDTAGEELAAFEETLDAEELGATEAALDDEDVNIGALDELLEAILATDDVEEAADEVVTFSSNGAAAVCTIKDFMGDQLPTPSPALMPYTYVLLGATLKSKNSVSSPASTSS